jgi:hypothetical protein
MIMKKILLAILAIGIFGWLSGGSASDSTGVPNSSSRNASPESMVVCLGRGPHDYVMGGISVPASISDEQCIQPVEPHDTGLCAPCLRDLERQGCTIIDVVVGTEEYTDGSAFPAATVVVK